MILVGIFDFYHFDELTVVSSTDWLAIIVTSILSAVVAVLTVYLTYRFQSISSIREDIETRYNIRLGLVELNKQINRSLFFNIRSIKRCRNQFNFAANKVKSIYQFNSHIFRTLDDYSVSELLNAVQDIKMTNQEKKDLVDYKLSLNTIAYSLESLTSSLSTKAKETEIASLEVDNVITECMSEFQTSMFSLYGKTFQAGNSSVFPWLLVIKNEKDAIVLKFYKKCDITIKTYQDAMKLRVENIRILQTRMLKDLLKISRDYQRHNILPVQMVQKFQTSISLIEREKALHRITKESMSDHINLLNKQGKKIRKFIRVLERKHRKYSLIELKKSVNVFSVR